MAHGWSNNSRKLSKFALSKTAEINRQLSNAHPVMCSVTNLNCCWSFCFLAVVSPQFALLFICFQCVTALTLSINKSKLSFITLLLLYFEVLCQDYAKVRCMCEFVQMPWIHLGRSKRSLRSQSFLEPVKTVLDLANMLTTFTTLEVEAAAEPSVFSKVLQNTVLGLNGWLTEFAMLRSF